MSQESARSLRDREDDEDRRTGLGGRAAFSDQSARSLRDREDDESRRTGIARRPVFSDQSLFHSPFVLTASGLHRSFRVGSATVHALRDVSLRVPRARLTILQGPSGSGKTTLINILGALDYPTSGQVEFEHRNVVGLSDHERDELRRRRMGFVFQSVALIGVMSAFENVDFALRVAGYDDERRERRARDCLSLVGLRGRMDHRPGELSGGEQQRVAIARAIAHEPALLFADEPTAELDTHTGLQVMALVRSLVREHGVTVVMSSHDPYIVELADHLVRMEDGRLVNRERRDD